MLHKANPNGESHDHKSFPKSKNFTLSRSKVWNLPILDITVTSHGNFTGPYYFYIELTTRGKRAVYFFVLLKRSRSIKWDKKVRPLWLTYRLVLIDFQWIFLSFESVAGSFNNLEHLYVGSISFKSDVETVHDFMSDDVRRSCGDEMTVQHERTIREIMETTKLWQSLY